MGNYQSPRSMLRRKNLFKRLCGIFLIYSKIFYMVIFRDDMQHNQMHIQKVPRCTFSRVIWTLLETSITARNFFLISITRYLKRIFLLAIVRMHAMNYNKMIFRANIYKIQMARKFVAQISVAKECRNSLLLHSLSSIN